MTKKSEARTLIGEGFTAISQNIGPSLQKLVEDLKLNEIQGWQSLLLGTAIAPEPINSQRALVRGAYNKSEKVQEGLDELVAGGYLTADYVTTDKAKQLMEDLLSGQRIELEKLQPISGDKLERLIALFAKITDSISQSSISTPCFDDVIRRGVPADMHPIEKYVRHASYFNAFRDDVHINTWKPYNISGHAWEIFSYIWQGDAKSPADLPEGLRTIRGFTEVEDQQAVQELLNRDWIAPTDTDGEYTVTKRGQQIRDKAETATDELFYSTWVTLSDNELEELATLVTELRDELQKTIPQPEEA